MINPCPKPLPKRKQDRSIPPEIRKLVRERDKETCQACGKPSDDIHHIIKRSQADKDWVHDPRNLECLCRSCHIKTETHHTFRRERERQAVRRWGWLAGREMTLEEWEEWRIVHS